MYLVDAEALALSDSAHERRAVLAEWSARVAEIRIASPAAGPVAGSAVCPEAAPRIVRPLEPVAASIAPSTGVAGECGPSHPSDRAWKDRIPDGTNRQRQARHSSGRSGRALPAVYDIDYSSWLTPNAPGLFQNVSLWHYSICLTEPHVYILARAGVSELTAQDRIHRGDDLRTHRGIAVKRLRHLLDQGILSLWR
jgi:hypothetical protein